MVRIEEVRDFAVERSAAFDYITDPNNWDRYWPDLVNVAGLPTARWSMPGDVMRLRMRLLGRAVDLHLTLDTVDRPNRVAYHTVQAGLPDTDHERLFEPRNNGFRYRLTVSYRPVAGSPPCSTARSSASASAGLCAPRWTTWHAAWRRTGLAMRADGVTVLVGVAGHAAARTLRGWGRDRSRNGAG